MLNDKKVRFQHSSFRRQLQEARDYKRTPKKIAEKPVEIFLARVGLGSWKARAFVIAVLILAVYLVYVPNFWFVKVVETQGLSTEVSEQLKSAAFEYMGKHPLSAQKNLVWLSTDKLSAYLLKTQPEILSITNITKKYPTGIAVTANERIDRYALTTANGNYIVSNDGLVSNQFSGPIPTSTPALVQVTFKGDKTFQKGERILDAGLTTLFELASQNFNKDSKTAVSFFELADENSPDVTLHTQSGYDVLLDRQADPQKVLEQLTQILSDVTDQKIGAIGYIDLRLKSRGFLCYKNTACMIDQPLPKPADSTSSPDTSI